MEVAREEAKEVAKVRGALCALPAVLLTLVFKPDLLEGTLKWVLAEEARRDNMVSAGAIERSWDKLEVHKRSQGWIFPATFQTQQAVPNSPSAFFRSRCVFELVLPLRGVWSRESLFMLHRLPTCFIFINPGMSATPLFQPGRSSCVQRQTPKSVRPSLPSPQ